MLFLPREEGQGLVEYALVLVLIALALAIVLGLFGEGLEDLYTRVVAMFRTG